MTWSRSSHAAAAGRGRPCRRTRQPGDRAAGAARSRRCSGRCGSVHPGRAAVPGRRAAARAGRGIRRPPCASAPCRRSRSACISSRVGVDRDVQALEFVFHRIGGDALFDDFQRVRQPDPGTTERAAARCAVAGEQQAHRSAVLVESSLEQRHHGVHAPRLRPSPSTRTVTGVPWPAASSITPMMLLALTSRPLADRVALQRKPDSTCTSLAVARACRPRRLETVSSRSSIVDYRSIACAGGSGCRQLIQSLFRIIHHPQQHRQAQRGHAPHRRAQPRQLRRPGCWGWRRTDRSAPARPSPPSTRRNAAEACGSKTSRSASNGTSNASAFSGNCRNSAVATASSDAPIPGCVTRRMPQAMRER